MTRFGIGIITAAAVLVVIGLLAWNAPPPLLPVDLIAYVTSDAKVEVIAPDGTAPTQISPDVDGFFTWPTWSPDAQSIVFSSVTEDPEGAQRISLMSSDTDGGNLREIYVNEPGSAGLLAEETVHYSMWSPDGRHLAFIATTPQGLSLFLDDLTDDPGAERLLDDGPLWTSWSADSRYLAAHRGDQHFVVDVESDDERRITALVGPSGVYRVPAWAPDQATVSVVTADRRGQHTITSIDVTGIGASASISDVPTSPSPAFTWSPDGKHLAIADSGRIVLYNGLGFLLYTALTVRGEDVSASVERIRGNVVAHFWSPDGTKLAFVTLASTQGTFQWNILEVESGEQWSLPEFTPSLEQFVVFQFFDQYAYSHQPWSPNSDALVFAGKIRSGALTASYAAGQPAADSDVIVVGTAPGSTPVVVAEGRMAFWSPR